MANGKNHCFRKEFPSVGACYPDYFILFQKELIHTCIKMDFSAPGQDLLTHVLHYFRKDVRSDMGLVFIQDPGRSPMLYQDAEHFAASSFFILNQRIQFPIGKGSRSAFPELHVGIRQTGASSPEILHIPGSGLHILSPFQQDGAVSGPCQQISAEKPRGSHPDNDQAVPCALRSRFREAVNDRLHQGNTIIAAPSNHIFLTAVFQRYVHYIGKPYLRLLSGIYGLLHHIAGSDLFRGKTQGLGGFFFHRLRRMARFQFHLLYPNHIFSSQS